VEVFAMKEKLTKEEKEAQREQRETIKKLLGGASDLQAVEELVKDFRKVIIETMYDEELKTHLGFSKNEGRPENSNNYRNGSYAKTVRSSAGEIELSVPRDRNGEFEPQIVKKYQTDIFGIEDKIISLYGCGMTTRDISENIRELYGFDVSAEVVSNVTNRVLTEVKEWQSRPLKSVYAVVYMDGISFKVKKDGVIQKCTAYGCVGVDMDGQKEVLSMHIGGCESAKYWLTVMNDLKARGVQQILIFCTDNLKGLDDAIKSCFPDSHHQKCIVHQIRNSVKHVSYKDLKEVCGDLKAIYAASTADIGKQKLDDFAEKWDEKYAYISRSWNNNWEQLSTFWIFPQEIRRLIYTTNPIESFNRCMRKVTKNRPTFPSEDALIKSLFLGIRRLEKKWTTKVHDWGIIYSQLMILFDVKLDKIAA
jgi:transposase-like protein